MRRVTDRQRRAALQRRHLLDGRVTGPEQVVGALVALHAADAAAALLSVLTRTADLERRLGGVVVTPAARTPGERRLAGRARPCSPRVGAMPESGARAAHR